MLAHLICLMPFINGLEQVGKKHSWEILLVMLLLTSNLQAKPEIIDQRVLSGETFNTSYMFSVMFSMNMFIDGNDMVFVEALRQKDFYHRDEEFLWLNNNWVNTVPYGDFMNGFVRNGCVCLAFGKDRKNIDVYSVGKEVAFEKRITSSDPCGFYYIYSVCRVIAVPGDNNVSYTYVLGVRDEVSSNPVERRKFYLSGGHGIVYDQPVLAELRGQTLSEDKKIPYGGITDESYRIEKVLTGKDMIYLLGFRTQEQMGSGFGDRPPTPVILHYAAYNVKKKKLMQSQDIYENTPHHESGAKNEHINYSYGKLSADNLNDEGVVVIFSWVKHRFIDKGNAITEDEIIQSQIYYAQCGRGKFSGLEKIGEGDFPLVKVDSFGNIHAIWENKNHNGSLVHRVKKDGKWSDEEVFLSGVDNPPGMLFGVDICAAFDKNNILNVVFPSNGNIVHAKIRFD